VNTKVPGVKLPAATVVVEIVIVADCDTEGFVVEVAVTVTLPVVDGAV
jgi:hypothetical protein